MTDSHDGFRDLTSIGDMFKSCIAHMKVRALLISTLKRAWTDVLSGLCTQLAMLQGNAHKLLIVCMLHALGARIFIYKKCIMEVCGDGSIGGQLLSLSYFLHPVSPSLSLSLTRQYHDM